MPAQSDVYTALEGHIAAMCSKVLEQLTENPTDLLSVSDIDALESSLEQNLRRPLRSLRNSRQLCNRIPPEIVTRIAHHCSSPTFDTPWYVCLLKSTHLCRRWREVITSCASLWTLIHMQPPKIASIFLERSGDLPLDIYTLSEHCYEPIHLKRIRALRLRESSPDGLAKIFSRLAVPSPILTEVIIDGTGSTYGYCPDLPPLFGDMSTIRSLSLDGISFDAKLLHLTSLTSLTLYIIGALLPPFFDLLTINPALESISISAWGAIPVEKVDGPVITLDNLVTFHCRDASKQILSRLSIPHSTSIQIEDTGPPLSLSRSFPASITNIRCLSQVFSLHLTTATGTIYSGLAMDTHSVSLVGRGGTVDVHWVVGYDGLQELDPGPLSLDRVRVLSITHNTNLERPRASELDLSPLFNAMKSLEVLKIHSCLPTDHHFILPPFLDDPVCPSLHTVEIIHCSGEVQWLSALLDLAIRRRDTGVALRKVLISPDAGPNSPIRSYLKKFRGVLSDSAEIGTV